MLFSGRTPLLSVISNDCISLFLRFSRICRVTAQGLNLKVACSVTLPKQDFNLAHNHLGYNARMYKI